MISTAISTMMIHSSESDCKARDMVAVFLVGDVSGFVCVCGCVWVGGWQGGRGETTHE